MDLTDEELGNFLHPNLFDARAFTMDAPNTPIKLNQNETPFDWPEDLKERVCEKLKSRSWNRYPSAFADEVTELLANYAKVPVKNIMTGPGTNHLITIFLSALTRKLKGQLYIARPTFPLYEAHCQYEGIPYKIWEMTKDLEYDINRLPSIPEYSIVAFASPNNPTGTTLAKDDLEVLLKKHPTSLFLADEAYFEFSDENYSSLAEDYSNIILFRTCSKTLGAAGVRLGYAIGPANLITQVSKLRLPFLLNHFTIVAAQEFLKEESIRMRLDSQLRVIKEERDRIYEELKQLSNTTPFRVMPSKTNFFVVRFSSQDKCDQAYQGLIEAGILVRNISKGPGLQGCLRVTVGTPPENDVFLRASKSIFS